MNIRFFLLEILNFIILLKIDFFFYFFYKLNLKILDNNIKYLQYYNMYFKNEIIEKIKVFSTDINHFDNYIEELDNLLISKIKYNIGNKCLKYGLVNKDSIKMISRSCGYFNEREFNSSVTYKIKFIADICNPIEGSFIDCKIISSNKMGLMGIIGDNVNTSPLIILIAKQYHLKNNKFKNIKIGDIINIEVIGKKFEINDTYISIIGKIPGDEEDEDDELSQDQTGDNNYSEKLSEELNDSKQIESQSEIFENDNQMNNFDDDLDLSLENLNSYKIKKIIKINNKNNNEDEEDDEEEDDDEEKEEDDEEKEEDDEEKEEDDDEKEIYDIDEEEDEEDDKNYED